MNSGFSNIQWKEKDEEEIYNFFDNLEDPTDKAKFLIFMVKNYPGLDLIYLELMEDLADSLLYQHKSELVEQMIDTFREAFPEEYIEDYEFMEKSLVQYYFFQNNIPKVLERLEIVKQNPAQGIDTITIRSLYLLIFHGCYQEAYDYSLQVWEPIFNSDKIYGMGHAPFVINIYLFELEQAYENIKKNKPVNWNAFRKKMKDYDFEENKDVMNMVTHCLENPFDKQEIVQYIKSKQHRKAHTMMNIYFSKYMKDTFNMSFTHSDLLFNILAKEDLYKNKSNPENYFLFSFDKLDKHLAGLYDSFFQSNIEEMFARVWGLEYAYRFIYACGMISDEGYEQMRQNIQGLKFLFISIANEEIWKMAFVFKWPDLYARDPQIESIFRSTFIEDFDMLPETFLEYKRLLYEALPDNIKKEVNDPDDYPNFENFGFPDESSDFFNSSNDYEGWVEPYVKDEPDIGRNDPCPCGSGKKFKKCCLGKN